MPWADTYFCHTRHCVGSYVDVIFPAIYMMGAAFTINLKLYNK